MDTQIHKSVTVTYPMDLLLILEVEQRFSTEGSQLSAEILLNQDRILRITTLYVFFLSHSLNFGHNW